MLIWTFVVHNVSAIISYDQKQLLDIILDLDEHFYYNESAALDNLPTPEQALIPRTQKEAAAKREATLVGT